MAWNWQLPDWPHFRYDIDQIVNQERSFLLGLGSASACLKNISQEESTQFVVDILSLEGSESSRIEGEILDRNSLQSSIKKHFGLEPHLKKEKAKEAKMAALLCHVYETFDQPLTHEMLGLWHSILFKDSSALIDIGKYRTHSEPMQIVSGRYNSPRVFFEAPPSAQVPQEMTTFIEWFNSIDKAQTTLGKAAIAHVYFESIHPFEDGNGRIGRILVEKLLSQSIGRPVLIAFSKILEKRKKVYYLALERCNRTLDIQKWVEFFASIILEGQEESMTCLYFLIAKSKILTTLTGKINSRQEKVLLRLFAEGPSGFKGGLSADNYITITKTSRSTATRDLADLVHKGVLTQIGELRHTRYYLKLS